MSGIFPDGGVTSSNTQGGTEVDLVLGCTALFYSLRCNQKFDPVATNNMMSELLNSIKACEGFEWDCNRNDNLERLLTQIKDSIPEIPEIPDLGDVCNFATPISDDLRDQEIVDGNLMTLGCINGDLVLYNPTEDGGGGAGTGCTGFVIQGAGQAGGSITRVVECDNQPIVSYPGFQATISITQIGTNPTTWQVFVSDPDGGGLPRSGQICCL